MGNKISLYCAGGAGINVGAMFESYRDKVEPGFAEIVINYLDTSKSNLGFNPPNESVYLIDDVDGSGKQRGKNHKVISERSKEMLLRFPPTDLNVVIHSASGGKLSVN